MSLTPLLPIDPIELETVVTPHQQPRLSKSRIMSGLQCHKRLWLELYRRDYGVYHEGVQTLFNQGNLFGEIARNLIAQAHSVKDGNIETGFLIESIDDPIQALKDTATALSQYRIVFEPAFRYEGVFVRADVLIRNDKGDNEPTYTMIEVKAASNLKQQYVRDAAIQTWVLRHTGLNVTRIELAHVNTEFVYNGKHYTGLITRKNITDLIEKEVLNVQKWIDEQRAMLRVPVSPDISMGKQCTSPYACPFMDYCGGLLNHPINPVHSPITPITDALKPQYPISLLPGVKGKVLAKRLEAEGYIDLLNTPIDKLEGFAFIQEVYRNNQPFYNAALAQELLMQHSKPWGYLDFETISPAVPLWEGMQPFVHWPFQWSIHLENNKNYTHYEYLNLTHHNIIESDIASLLSAFKGFNTIWAYNAPFERQVLLRLSKTFLKYTVELIELSQKIHDLIPIIQACYYHPLMQGSYSLKSVLPTIAPELNYDQLQGIQHGNAAQAAFFEGINPSCSLERHKELTTQLKNYCKLDTWAMVVLVHRLLNIPYPI